MSSFAKILYATVLVAFAALAISFSIVVQGVPRNHWISFMDNDYIVGVSAFIFITAALLFKCLSRDELD